GVMALMELSEFTLKLAALAEPKVTALASRRFVPLIVTGVPPDRAPNPGLTSATVAGFANTDAHPSSKSFAPTSAERPVLDSATVMPNSGGPLSTSPCQLGPEGANCSRWLQVEPARVNRNAVPTSVGSSLPLPGAPISAVSPSDDTATLSPKWPSTRGPPAVSFPPCWVQVDPERVKTQAAPTLLRRQVEHLLSSGPPISAVFPSAESATLSPNSLLPT